MPHQSRSGRSDDVPGHRNLHGVPQHDRKGSAGDSEANGVGQILPADSLGARLSDHSWGHLDAPQTFAGWHAMRDVPWQRCSTRCHGSDHQRVSHGELHWLPSVTQCEYRMRHLPCMAAAVLKPDPRAERCCHAIVCRAYRTGFPALSFLQRSSRVGYSTRRRQQENSRMRPQL